MQGKPEWAAPCGLYCGVCGILYAHRDNNVKFKEKLSVVYAVPIDQIRCEGCLSGDVFMYCQVCPIKACAQSKGYEGCHQCGQFPCQAIEDFPMPVGKKVIMRAVPFRREHGTEAWMADEEQRYVCSHCGNKLFRGAKRCNKCGETISAD
jgi:ribosomal protein L40E